MEHKMITAVTIAGTVVALLGLWLGFETHRRVTLLQERLLKAAQEGMNAALRTKPGIEGEARPGRDKRLTRRGRLAGSVPSWALGLMADADARRYAWEWSAHLLQLIEEGEIRQARRDRRRLALAAVTLAIALRVRRVLGRAR
jgi:hypothetical protein